MARSDRYAQRNAYVEASLEGAVDLLRSVEPVQQRLGTYATELADIIEYDLFPAPVRSGDYRFPKESLQTDAIPVFSLLPSEHVEVVGAGLTPRQIKNISETRIDANLGFSPEEMHQIATVYSNGASKSRGGKMEFMQSSGAQVSSRTQEIPLANGPALILGRPVMAILFDKGKSRLSPDIVVHEATHIFQRLSTPLREAGKKAQALKDTASELEAYRIQSLFVQGLIEYGYKPKPNESGHQNSSGWTYAMEIESLRLKYADPQAPYAVTRKMSRKMKPFSHSLKLN